MEHITYLEDVSRLSRQKNASELEGRDRPRSVRRVDRLGSVRRREREREEWEREKERRQKLASFCPSKLLCPRIFD